MFRLIALAMIWSLCFALQGNSPKRWSMAEPKGLLLVVYDNNTLKRGLTASWGFSCFIDLPHSCILFDTRGNASILLKNMYRTEIDPRKIDNVVSSHGHGDHTGGLGKFLQFHHDVTVYIPKSFPRSFKKEVGLTGARVREVGGPMMIHSGIYTTGELGGFMKEQSLVLKTREGLVIITGCAHPKIVKIVERAVELFREKVYLLLGGFHLMGRSRENIRAIIGRLDELKVERIAPCHCSGDRARELFRRHYGENYIDCGVGLESEIPALQR